MWCILSSCRHPGIIQFLNCWSAESRNCQSMLTGRHGNLYGLYVVHFRGALESLRRCCSFSKRCLPGATCCAYKHAPFIAKDILLQTAVLVLRGRRFDCLHKTPRADLNWSIMSQENSSTPRLLNLQKRSKRHCFVLPVAASMTHTLPPVR